MIRVANICILFLLGSNLFPPLLLLIVPLLALAALILGIIGRKRAKENGMDKEQKAATTGMILGIVYWELALVGFVLTVLITVL